MTQYEENYECSISSKCSNELEDSDNFDQFNDEDSVSSPISELENQSFSRKFLNIDLTTCWLNSCLQLILVALDHHDGWEFYSELGIELSELKANDPHVFLNAIQVKNILITAEDTRIATRMSELRHEVIDQDQLNGRMRNIEDLRLNLTSGQQ